MEKKHARNFSLDVHPYMLTIRKPKVEATSTEPLPSEHNMDTVYLQDTHTIVHVSGAITGEFIVFGWNVEKSWINIAAFSWVKTAGVKEKEVKLFTTIVLIMCKKYRSLIGALIKYMCALSFHYAHVSASEISFHKFKADKQYLYYNHPHSMIL